MSNQTTSTSAPNEFVLDANGDKKLQVTEFIGLTNYLRDVGAMRSRVTEENPEGQREREGLAGQLEVDFGSPQKVIQKYADLSSKFEHGGETLSDEQAAAISRDSLETAKDIRGTEYTALGDYKRVFGALEGATTELMAAMVDLYGNLYGNQDGVVSKEERDAFVAQIRKGPSEEDRQAINNEYGTSLASTTPAERKQMGDAIPSREAMNNAYRRGQAERAAAEADTNNDYVITEEETATYVENVRQTESEGLAQGQAAKVVPTQKEMQTAMNGLVKDGRIDEFGTISPPKMEPKSKEPEFHSTYFKDRPVTISPMDAAKAQAAEAASAIGTANSMPVQDHSPATPPAVDTKVDATAMAAAKAAQVGAAPG